MQSSQDVVQKLQGSRVDPPHVSSPRSTEMIPLGKGRWLLTQGRRHTEEKDIAEETEETKTEGRL